MSDDIKQKIEELLTKYNEIDTEVNKLIDGARIQTISPDISPDENVPDFFGERIYDSTDIPRDTYKLQSPNEENYRLQRQIVQQYGLWCDEAEIIVKSYLPDKIDEFRYFKSGNSLEYGILSILRFTRVYENLPDKRDIIRDFNFKFDAQKNILLALARTIHLLPPKKIESQAPSVMAESATKGTTIFNINTQTQTMNMDVNIQKFEELRSIIQKSAETNELKENLLSQVDELEKSKGTQKYTESYQKFMDAAANTATKYGNSDYRIKTFYSIFNRITPILILS